MRTRGSWLKDWLVCLGIEIDPTRAQTNIVIFDVSGTGMSASEFTHKLAEKNLLAGTADAQRVRFVTHMDVNREACEKALEAVKEVVSSQLVSALLRLAARF